MFASPNEIVFVTWRLRPCCPNLRPDEPMVGYVILHVAVELGNLLLFVQLPVLAQLLPLALEDGIVEVEGIVFQHTLLHITGSHS